MITKKEAMKDYYDEGYSHGYVDGYKKAELDCAEKLNKIRAELKAKADCMNFGDRNDYKEGVQFGLMISYQIINKVENEETDADSN